MSTLIHMYLSLSFPNVKVQLLMSVGLLRVKSFFFALCNPMTPSHFFQEISFRKLYHISKNSATKNTIGHRRIVPLVEQNTLSKSELKRRSFDHPNGWSKLRQGEIFYSAAAPFLPDLLLFPVKEGLNVSSQCEKGSIFQNKGYLL